MITRTYQWEAGMIVVLIAFAGWYWTHGEPEAASIALLWGLDKVFSPRRTAPGGKS